MKRSYVITDKDGELWMGGDHWAEGLDRAARFSTLLGVSEALCRLAPGTDRKRYPLYIARWRPVRRRK